ncbi:MAG TPA: peptide ABC transporter substrate-binding protein [Gemmatimonadales bacterium]|nr:peptide ABC transporter substrate-binding protein [Gemmatimonadales bacterium]
MNPSRRSVSFIAAGLLVGSLSACTARGGCSGDHCGTLVIAALGQPDILLPPITQLAIARDVSDQLFLKLADVGMSANTIGDGDFVPQLAARWDWTDSVTLTFHLDPRAKWQDGVPVTAADVAFTFDIYSDSTVNSPSRPALREIVAVRPLDSLTAVFRFRRPYAEMFYDAVYHMRVLPAHLLRALPRTAWQAAPFGRQPIGDGPYRFVSWKAGESLELAADSTFFLGRPHLRRLIWRFTPNLDVAVTQLIAGQADAIEVLGPPDNVKRVHDVAGLATYPYPGTTYGFLAFNLRANGDTGAPHPVFGNRNLRRAVVMALDREGMLHNVWGDLAAVPPGPMPRLWSLWDSILARSLAHDSAAAARLVAQRGRRAFHLLVPTTSGLRRQYARLIQAQLQPFGLDVRVDEVDFSVVQQRVGSGQFDAVVWAWATSPSPIDATRENWTRRGFGGGNMGRYDNPQLDRLVEDAAATRNRDAATRLLRSAIALWNSDAPAAPLYAPDNVAAVNRRVSEVTIRPDSWLALVRMWRIPASQLSDRDRVGT